MTGEELLKLKRVTLDVECLRDVKSPYSFGRSEFLGNAVTCTYANTGNQLEGGEYKDWVEDKSVPALWAYLSQFDIIITFNGISFDYPLLGGCFFGPENQLARSFFENSYKGKHVDLLHDFKETLGVRVGLNAVSVPTLGDAKEMEGGYAPQHYRAGRIMEVIEYCRGDVRRTDNLFVKACLNEQLKVKTKAGDLREFTCLPKLR